MEKTYPDNVVYSQEQNIGFEQKQHKAAPIERPILLQIFNKVFIGFFAEIGTGVFHFFKRYLVLISDCLKFLWKPNAEEHTRANEKTLENAKETFEFILIITAITLFLIRQDIIESTAELKELYGNDIGQITIEFLYFLMYALAFFTVLIILVLLGRLLRQLFKPVESRHVTDKIFINLNNIFFLLTTIYAFVKKCDPHSRSAALGETDNTQWVEQFFIYYGLPLTCVVFLFFIRLVTINKVTVWRVLTYCIITPTLTTMILAFCGLVIMTFFAYI
jgi:hypothetical protein